jgi:tetratricopeptide (TPR) repeat protein
VEKSLVTVCHDQDPIARYRLLETVQHYAQARLVAAGEERRVRDRHLQWYLFLAEQVRPYLWGTAGPNRLSRLEVEQDNLRAALAWAIETGQVEEGTRLAVALGWWWYVRAQLHEGRYWLERVLAVVQSASPQQAAYAFNAAAALALLSGDYDRAALLAGHTIQLDCERGCTVLAAWSLYQLGHIALYEGSFELADQLFQSSLAAFQNMQDRFGIASLMMYRGLAACYLGDYPRAVALLDESLAQLREIDHDLSCIERIVAEPDVPIGFYRESISRCARYHSGRRGDRVFS